MSLYYGDRHLHVDLGARSHEEAIISFERGEVAIAVEIKSFGGPSLIAELEAAIGQFVLYNLLLEALETDRLLYLAIPVEASQQLFAEPIGELVLEKLSLRVVVIDCEFEEVLEWNPPPNIATS